MLFLLRCLFTSDFYSCSMMDLRFVASVLRYDCCWIFLGLFTLTWRWILFLQLYWLSMCLGGYLAIVKVFLVRFGVVSAQGCVCYQVTNQSKYCGINLVLCRLEYSAYWCQNACGVDNIYDNDCVNDVCWSYRWSNFSSLGCSHKFRFVGLLGWQKNIFLRNCIFLPL